LAIPPSSFSLLPSPFPLLPSPAHGPRPTFFPSPVVH
jgi:hypothetical protein